MQKVAGVQSVRVSLNDGLTILDLTPGNGVTLEKLRGVIKRNGFVPKEAAVRVRGTVGGTGSALTLQSAGASERFSLERDDRHPNALTTVKATQSVEVEGTVAPNSERLLVRDVRPSPEQQHGP
jgi:hypothetical protein